MKEPPEGSVRKRDALEILEAAKGGMVVTDFAIALFQAGFWIRGPRKAYNVLDRLLRQGLVTRETEEEEVGYLLKGSDRPVRRRQRVVYWVISPKGKKRLDWYRDQDS